MTSRRENTGGRRLRPRFTRRVAESVNEVGGWHCRASADSSTVAQSGARGAWRPRFCPPQRVRILLAGKYDSAAFAAEVRSRGASRPESDLGELLPRVAEAVEADAWLLHERQIQAAHLAVWLA